MTVIVIDPGHGGSDPGATNGSYKEKDFTLSIALKIRDYLLANYQVSVLMTRTTDITVSLSQRTNFANSRNADYFCSIHINAGGGTGWETYIYNGPVSTQTIQARDVIHNQVISVIANQYGVRNRGKKTANFFVLRKTNMPAILIENLFIDTSSDLNLLRNNNFITDLANAIGEGIAKVWSLPRKILYKVIAGAFKDKLNAENRRIYLSSRGIESIIVKVQISGETWYRVQAGAFSILQNAEDRLQEVRQAGIRDAYIIQE